MLFVIVISHISLYHRHHHTSFYIVSTRDRGPQQFGPRYIVYTHLYLIPRIELVRSAVCHSTRDCGSNWDPKARLHISYRENKNLMSTSRHTSMNTHLGVDDGDGNKYDSEGARMTRTSQQRSSYMRCGCSLFKNRIELS